MGACYGSREEPRTAVEEVVDACFIVGKRKLHNSAPRSCESTPQGRGDKGAAGTEEKGASGTEDNRLTRKNGGRWTVPFTSSPASPLDTSLLVHSDVGSNDGVGSPWVDGRGRPLAPGAHGPRRRAARSLLHNHLERECRFQCRMLWRDLHLSVKGCIGHGHEEMVGCWLLCGCMCMWE